MTKDYDAIVIGSGPNGLAAGITLARAGLSVVIFEAKESVGGGMRTAELTLPGFFHDICSAIHPLGIGSPFFRSLPLDKYGLEWIQPSAPLAHPFEDGSVALLERSLVETCQNLRKDGDAYRKLMAPLVDSWDSIEDDLLGPIKIPTHPFALAQFGFLAMQSANGLIKRFFKEEWAKGLFAGLAAHSILPLDKVPTAAFALILGILGHKVGWPLPKGGSQKIADALAAYFKSLGGQIVTGTNIENVDSLPKAKIILCDVTPKQLLKIASHRFPASYVKKLEKYRYGPGVFKVDWALSQPIPWKAKECLRAGTVHVGGTVEEISTSEKEIWENKSAKKPFILMAQQSLFDPSRAPPGKQTAWSYCHVPNGSTIDMTEIIEAQIEKFAPGFRDCILARHSFSPRELEEYNSNYIGGDINGGVQDLYQLFSRPTLRLVPYSTPDKQIFICSSSTPPGGGVHGMCGYHAAKAALEQIKA
jgi:phytoene dehydrogenase-like protein